MRAFTTTRISKLYGTLINYLDRMCASKLLFEARVVDNQHISYLPASAGTLLVELDMTVISTELDIVAGGSRTPIGNTVTTGSTHHLP